MISARSPIFFVPSPEILKKSTFPSSNRRNAVFTALSKMFRSKSDFCRCKYEKSLHFYLFLWSFPQMFLNIYNLEFWFRWMLKLTSLQSHTVQFSHQSSRQQVFPAWGRISVPIHTGWKSQKLLLSIIDLGNQILISPKKPSRRFKWKIQ